jgi:hypothetical protein
MRHVGLRSQLSAGAASAAGPYGYTISLGGSIAIAVDQLGSPHLGGALLMMLGAVAAFVALEVVAQRSVVPQPAQPDRPPSVWGNAHIPSAGAALCGVWGAIHLVDDEAGWLLTGFVATGVYFVVTAVQRIAFDALTRRSRTSDR